MSQIHFNRQIYISNFFQVLVSFNFLISRNCTYKAQAISAIINGLQFAAVAHSRPHVGLLTFFRRPIFRLVLFSIHMTFIVFFFFYRIMQCAKYWAHDDHDDPIILFFISLFEPAPVHSDTDQNRVSKFAAQYRPGQPKGEF